MHSFRIFLILILGIVGHSSISAQSAQAQIMEEVRIESLQGSYQVFGRNSNGTAYSGRLQVNVREGFAYFQWQIGKTQYSGVGKLTGNALVVNWGNSPPVVYTIDLNGNLAGTWDNGRASERLIKDRST